MQSKPLVIAFTILTLVFATHVYAAEKAKAKVAPISESMAEELVANQKGKLKPQNSSTAILYDERNATNQSFKINIASLVFYLVSSTKNRLPYGESTCTILLFNESRKILSAVDTFPVDNESAWVCEGTEAMSFLDHYSDGSLKIIALYRGLPPSNERFISPVVLKLDINKQSLSIDEVLTKKFEDKDIQTIKAARAVLNRK